MAASCVMRALVSAKPSRKLLSPTFIKVNATVHPIVPCHPTQIPVRTGVGILGKVTAEDLWRSATSVSNAGRKRGRAKGLRRRVDLNRGQKIGVGKAGTVFPGLSGPASMNNKLLPIHQSKVAQDEIRPPPEIKKRKSMRIPALQRGYSGRKLPGTSCGPPEPVYDYVFENFDSRILEYKLVSHMTGTLGRRSRLSALVITGNKKGLVGYAVAKSMQGKAAIRKAKNMAGQRLQFIETYNGHTVFHNFYVKEGGVKIAVEKVPKGYGLRCHRIIKTICQIVGIEDIYAKLEGSNNPQNICKAFIRGLLEQETHQKLADRKSLHVVEFREELQNVPIVVASPSNGQVTKQPITDVTFDFENMYYEDGKIRLKKTKDKYHFHQLHANAWKAFMERERFRNQDHAKRERIIYNLEPSEEEYAIRKRPLK